MNGSAAVTPATLKRQLNPIRHMMKIARTEWGLPIPTGVMVSTTVTGSRRERRLRQGEWDRLVKAAPRFRNPYILPIVVLAVETGMQR